MSSILVVEDEKHLADGLRFNLEAEGHKVSIAGDGERALEMLAGEAFDAVVLDVMLPGRDGFSVAAELRKSGQFVPILMLTARGRPEDVLQGFDSGADDYLPKPFDFQELLARVRALLRRDKIHKTRTIRVADLEIDTAQRRVTRGGVEIGLSHREYELLEALAAYESQVLTREAIQERIWMDEDSFSNTVDVYIGILRKKIDAGHAIKLIHTVRGVGYTLRTSGTEDTP